MLRFLGVGKARAKGRRPVQSAEEEEDGGCCDEEERDPAAYHDGSDEAESDEGEGDVAEYSHTAGMRHEDFMEAEGERSLLYLEDLFEKKGRTFLFHNRIKDESMRTTGRQLIRALRSRPSALSGVETLFFGDNDFGDSGIQYLMEELTRQEDTHFAALHLQFTKMGDRGCERVALSLGGFRELEYLSLAGNAIGNYGLVELCTAFDRGMCPYLSTLNLSATKIREVGVNALVRTLPGMTQLRYLHIRDCEHVPLCSRKALCDALERSSTLVHIDMGYSIDRTILNDERELQKRLEWLNSSEGNFYRRGQAWRPQSHYLYPRSVQECIETMLKLYMVTEDLSPIFPECSVWVLPKELLYFIFQYLVVSRDFVDKMVEKFKS